MRRRDILWFGLGAAALIGAGRSWRAFSADLEAARARTLGRSRIVASRYGALEVAEAGDGPPVLMIHGTGGGFDQGLAMSGPLRESRRVIAPSRFGYLRSAFPADPSSDNQADAFADLLDALGVDKAAIIGGSAGALSAMAFAIRHPDRTSALVALVPAAYAPGRPPVDPPNPLAQAIIEHGLKSDLLFWLGMKVSEDAMIASLLATDPARVRAASAAEQARVRAVLRDILPVSLRAEGLKNDARLAYTPAPMPIERITAPTLALSLEDDRFQTLAAARHIAATVPGAELVSFQSGGHIWAGRNAEVFAAVEGFLARHRA
ncbi:MAG: alpha/beta fold hydrolase [Hyphomonadaceae bacterium]|nr:alpha/beta fold hydrolase [Hyphomonadaceae bacterium]